MQGSYASRFSFKSVSASVPKTVLADGEIRHLSILALRIIENLDFVAISESASKLLIFSAVNGDCGLVHVYVYTYVRDSESAYYVRSASVWDSLFASRVSTRDKGQDVENQLRQLREFCAKQDWKIVNEYVDHASGKRGDREAFQQMFFAASRHEFDIVLFWSLDRFSREGVFETLQHLQKLTDFCPPWQSRSASD